MQSCFKGHKRRCIYFCTGSFSWCARKASESPSGTWSWPAPLSPKTSWTAAWENPRRNLLHLHWDYSQPTNTKKYTFYCTVTVFTLDFFSHISYIPTAAFSEQTVTDLQLEIQKSTWRCTKTISIYIMNNTNNWTKIQHIFWSQINAFDLEKNKIKVFLGQWYINIKLGSCSETLFKITFRSKRNWKCSWSW